MRTYKVKSMTCGGYEKSVTRAVKKQLGEDIEVEAYASRGEVRVSASADPQIVAFAIEGAGYAVEGISDESPWTKRPPARHACATSLAFSAQSP